MPVWSKIFAELLATGELPHYRSPPSPQQAIQVDLGIDPNQPM